MYTARKVNAYLKPLAAVFACTLLVACNTGNKSKTDNVLGGVTTQETTDASIPDRRNDLRAFCPKTIIREGTEVHRTFERGVKKDDPNALQKLRFQSTITEVARECNYTRTTLGMKVGVRGQVINGPTGATGTVNVPIRIAVVNPIEKSVVYSQLHQVPVTIGSGLNNAQFRFVDSQINIPVPEKENLVVYVGFDEGPPA